ncbi:hypothetical protein P4T89_04005 [Bacillus nakamurai]|nr:hypothetical protein [Bacillus nakamurai]MED1226787.1 hypothetical protein [Bacillus nakamurai]
MRDLNIPPHLSFEGEEAATILGLTAACLGAAVLPKTTEHQYFPVADYTCERIIALAQLKNYERSPAAERFKQFAVEYYNGRTDA